MTHILVIDNDCAMTDMLKVILEPEMFEVFSVSSDEEGIEAVKAVSPDAIILGLPHSGGDSWKIFRMLRHHTQAPILVLSALNKPGLVTRALDEGADDFLTKPVANSVLLAHLKTLVRRAEAEYRASASKNGS